MKSPSSRPRKQAGDSIASFRLTWPGRKKRQPPLNQQLLRKMKKIEQLPPRDQRPLLRTIDAYLKGAEKR